MTDPSNNRSANNQQSEPPEADTVTLNEPIQKLISAGAAAIGLEKEICWWDDEYVLIFKVHLPPDVGAAAVGQYNTAEFNGETYNIEWIFDVDGPSFFNRVPVYADDNILGMESVPVEAGWANLREFLRERDEKGNYE